MPDKIDDMELQRRRYERLCRYFNWTLVGFDYKNRGFLASQGGCSPPINLTEETVLKLEHLLEGRY